MSPERSKKHRSARGGVPRVCLTGSIASGKSLIRDILAREDVPTIDADNVVHTLLHDDTAIRMAIRDAFGDSVFSPSGEISRPALGAVVFADAEKRRLLESFIHPAVRQAMLDFFAAHEHDDFAVAVIPLFFESGLTAYYDAVWLVKADSDTQIERLVLNRGMDRSEAEARLATQMPFAEKLQQAQAMPHAVIDNTGSIETTEAQVMRLVAEARMYGPANVTTG